MTVSDTTFLLPNTDGIRMPAIGFGTWQVRRPAIATAAAAGYRAFDSATYYRTEKDVRSGLRDAGIAAVDSFLTTKVWRNDMTFAGALAAFEASRANFGVDVIDLILIHWPHSRGRNNLETWRAFEQLLAEGKVRAIGVSNFDAAELDVLAKNSGVVPAVNQVELNPFRQRTALVREMRDRGISVTAYSPLGQGGPVLRDPTLTSIAAAHGVSSAQVTLRWLFQQEIVSVPRSSNPERIRQNLDLDGFTLDLGEMARIDALSH